MTDTLSIARETVDRQVAMFSMFVGPGLHTTRAALSAASKFPTSTLKDWAHGAAMPFWAVLHLRRFLPADAINMLSEPCGVLLVDAEEGDSNWDDVAAEAAGLTAEICEARRDGKITPSERERLRKRGRQLVAEVQAAVGADG